MENGWYTVEVEQSTQRLGLVRKDCHLLYIDGKWYQDYDFNKHGHTEFNGKVLKVYYDTPKYEVNRPLDDDPVLLKGLIARIYIQAIEDLRESLVLYHYNESRYEKERIAECEAFLQGFKVRRHDVIEVTHQRANYIIFRKDHGCSKCKTKGCPHRKTEGHANGDFDSFGKVGCLNETDNT